MEQDIERFGFDAGDVLEVLGYPLYQFALLFRRSPRVHVDMHHRHNDLLKHMRFTVIISDPPAWEQGMQARRRRLWPNEVRSESSAHALL
jgi:hypothetical protein